MTRITDVLGVSKNNSSNNAQPQAEISLDILKKNIVQIESNLSNTSDEQHSPNSNLWKILQTQERIRKRKREEITFSKAIISRSDMPIIFPNTINLIQGQAGSHKSRFGELFMSIVLKRPECSRELLRFEANPQSSYTAIYVDSERNLDEQFPHALQQIQLNAGYYRSDEPDNFDYISLLEISRKDRFDALKAYLKHVRRKHNNHLFIVLDVVTDCIEDFNRTDNSMELTDMLNMAINTYNVTFLCIIHENPSSNNKARGHLGTELMNKSSTVIQVGFEKNNDGSDSNIIRLKFLKCRSTERIQPIYATYDKEERCLILAEENDVNNVFESRKSKANESDVIDHMEKMIHFPVPKSELISDLSKWFDASDRTITDRLEAIIKADKLIHKEGKPFLLFKDRVGKNTIFNIKFFESHEE